MRLHEWGDLKSGQRRCPSLSMECSPAQDIILHSVEPKIVEFPFSELSGPLTPCERFYIRNHFLAPTLKTKSYVLRVVGDVNYPLRLTLNDLASMPQTSQAVVLECAGNNRGLLRKKYKGAQWTLGGVGCALWTGVPLARILELASPRERAIETIFIGADRGNVGHGTVNYARSLPIQEALRPEVLLANEMNGEALPEPHGGPLRLVVPGWYAMASVKWLTHIVVSRRRFTGHFQSVEYTYQTSRQDGFTEPKQVTRLHPKAQIARPVPAETIPRASYYTIYGAAWGSAEALTVEVSTDKGRSWNTVRVHPRRDRYAWSLWEYIWRTPDVSQRSVVLARARNACQRQEINGEISYDGYMVHKVEPVVVAVS